MVNQGNLRAPGRVFGELRVPLAAVLTHGERVHLEHLKRRLAEKQARLAAARAK